MFDGTDIKGCAFHFCQAVYRKVQELGLGMSYINDVGTRRFCQKLMGLVYLPAVTINARFTALAQSAEEGSLIELCTYFKATWIESSNWPIEEISQFGEPIRTINDVECWHFRLNKLANRPKIQFYLLLQLLKSEADAVDINMALIGTGSIIKLQRKCTKMHQQRLIKAWQAYTDGFITVENLHSTCAHFLESSFAWNCF